MDTGSYDTVYQVDNRNNDVVICWTMTGIHVVYRIDSSSILDYNKHTRCT